MTDPNRRPSKLDDSILLIYSVDGTKNWIRVTPITEFFLDPLFVRFYIIVWALWALVYQRLGSFTEATWPPFAISIALGIITGVAFFLVAGGLKYVLKLLGRRAIYTPFFLLPVVLIHGAAAWYIYTHVSFFPSGQRQSISFLNIVTQNFLVMCLLDLLFGHYIAPNLKAKVQFEEDKDIAAASQAETKTARLDEVNHPKSLESPHKTVNDRNISICGIETKLGKIQKIESDGHYLNIFETDQVHKVRGRFSDAMSQFPSDIGVQASRSSWVSRSMIARAERKGSKLLLILKDQKKLPVARARVPDATDKLKGWQIAITRV